MGTGGPAEQPLAGVIALVAGATRGAGRGIAIELGAAGATVYVTGRTTRERRSEYDRPETIEATAELVTDAGGTGIAVPTDHLVPSQVESLVAQIARERDHLFADLVYVVPEGIDAVQHIHDRGGGQREGKQSGKIPNPDRPDK